MFKSPRRRATNAICAAALAVLVTASSAGCSAIQEDAAMSADEARRLHEGLDDLRDQLGAKDPNLDAIRAQVGDLERLSTDHAITAERLRGRIDTAAGIAETAFAQAGSLGLRVTGIGAAIEHQAENLGRAERFAADQKATFDRFRTASADPPDWLQPPTRDEPTTSVTIGETDGGSGGMPTWLLLLLAGGVAAPGVGALVKGSGTPTPAPVQPVPQPIYMPAPVAQPVAAAPPPAA